MPEPIKVGGNTPVTSGCYLPLRTTFKRPCPGSTHYPDRAARAGTGKLAGKYRQTPVEGVLGSHQDLQRVALDGHGEMRSGAEVVTIELEFLLVLEGDIGGFALEILH